MSHVTRSAKSGKTPVDTFDPGNPYITLEGVGRMQRRGIGQALFALEDNKAIPFVSVRGASKLAYVVNGQQFDKKGKLLSVEAKRARTNTGEYQGDDPSTPHKNEAWEGGKAPKKKKKSSSKKKDAKAKAPSASSMGL